MNQPYTVEVVAPAPSNAVRAHEHPMLESGNPSFPRGRYRLRLLPGDDRCSFRVAHEVEGASLVARLLESGDARCACVVSSPRSGYRQLHMAESLEHEVRWDVADLGEAPLFTPAILCVTRRDMKLRSVRDDVHRIWDKQSITLRKGFRLALGNVIQLQSSILHLLSLHLDDGLEDGRFHVEIESEPFRFKTHVGAALYRCLRCSGGVPRHNIMTHIVTACLARLQRDYRDDDDGDTGWHSHRNLRAFADYLAANGQPHWTDDGFRPEQVATEIYPLALPDDSES
ncbi:MAG: hypothetical protein OXH52_12950 [Gammaproteobacteria bacterium]|nr:hypothetical protein [Gammaproteobacteria bacterium]